ncbi:hypothetical protein DE146DRAFT_614119 [Phaeosphaeria sp. MPI-PUGE-AT-0046c]|nr:hypothetical protein DE146DRAFT_614119 [Phaeosphaeria sp. MPI-PUGE-AT-0046c]
MSSASYKGNLTVGGPSLDKSKSLLRRPTPDSDVLASSDEDREHVTRPPIRQATGSYSGARRLSSSWLHDIQPNRKNSLPSVSFAESQPTTPSLELPQQSRPGPAGFAWNTSSFTSNQSGSRLREVVPSPTSAFAPGDRALPSPTTIESDNGIGFLLNQQQQHPFRKAVRSQSYSIGQGDIENSPVGKFSVHLRSNLRHRPSKPSLLGDSGVGLSQLREDDVDDVDPLNGTEHGVRLPAGYWEREQNQALLKQAAVENARARNRATSTGSPLSQHRRKTTAGLRNAPYGAADYAIDELDDPEANISQPAMGLTRRFSEHVSVLARDHEVEIMDSPKKQQWATDNIPMLGADAMGRRHSFAHYSSYNRDHTVPTLSNTQEEDEEVTLPRREDKSPEDVDVFDASAYFKGYGPASRQINASAISTAHPDPPIVPNPAMSAGNPYAVPPILGRPGRRLFVVTFKCSRADIYYLYDNTGLEIRCGDLVIVEGDRGGDLGQVTHADVSLEEARRQKVKANEEHFRWLVMFSQYSLAGSSNDSGMLGTLARANGYPNAMSNPNVPGIGTQPEQDSKPKMIKRLAQQHEIMGLRDKEGSEAKAKRLGAQKAADHKLPMEILDAEYQADYHKLTYYYYAETYVNFNELVTDLFKQYKVRIWMSAINPASVVPPGGSMHQPPSAVGPGAIMHSNAMGSSHSVGPGFGNGSHRGNHGYGRGNRRTQQTNFDDGYNAFSYQLQGYNPQTNYNMTPWANQGQRYGEQMYGAMPMQSGGYPSATASGSPMNYGAYYPPTSYAASPAYGASTSGSSHRGTYGSATNATTGSAYGQYNPASSYNKVPISTAGGAGNGYTATSNTVYNNPGYDPTLVSAMQNMSFGGK